MKKSDDGVGMISKAIGRKKDDGGVVTTVKLLTPYGSVTGAIDSVKGSKARLASLIDDVNGKRGALKLSDTVLDPDLDPVVVADSLRRLQFIGRALLLMAMFIAVDVTLFLIFGFWRALFSAPAIALCYVLAGKYAFVAGVFRTGEFSHPTLMSFLLDRRNRWVTNLFLGED